MPKICAAAALARSTIRAPDSHHLMVCTQILRAASVEDGPQSPGLLHPPGAPLLGVATDEAAPAMPAGCRERAGLQRHPMSAEARERDWVRNLVREGLKRGWGWRGGGEGGTWSVGTP